MGFQDAAKKLMDCSVVSRVDADEAANLKKAIDSCGDFSETPTVEQWKKGPWLSRV